MASKEKTVYSLDLHETLVVKNSVGGNMEITRVPGGWLYALEYPGFRQSPVTFVPFDNGFMQVTKIKNIKYVQKQEAEADDGGENEK